jgi:hypothetical protein
VFLVVGEKTSDSRTKNFRLNLYRGVLAGKMPCRKNFAACFRFIRNSAEKSCSHSGETEILCRLLRGLVKSRRAIALLRPADSR